MDDIFDELLENIISLPKAPKNPFVTFETINGNFDVEFDSNDYNTDLFEFVLDHDRASIISITLTSYGLNTSTIYRELLSVKRAFSYLEYEEYDDMEKIDFLENDSCFEIYDGSDWTHVLFRSWKLNIRFWYDVPTYGIKCYIEIDNKVFC
jgi:hypothetical protein